MGCMEFDENQLLLFAYGELETEAAGRLKAHLAGCESCSRELEEIHGLRRFVMDARMPASPELAVVERLKNEARKRARGPGIRERLGFPRLFFPLRPAWAVLAAAVVIAAGISLYVIFNQPGETPLAYDSEAFNEMLAELEEGESFIVLDTDESENGDMFAALSSMEQEFSLIAFNDSTEDYTETWQGELEDLEEDFELLDEYFRTL